MFFYLTVSMFVCIFVFSSCSENIVSDVSFLSLKNSSSDSAKIESAEGEREYVIVPFSANSYSEGNSPSGALSYEIDFSGTGAVSRIFSPLSKRVDYGAAADLLKEEIRKRHENQFRVDRKRHNDTKMILEKISKGLEGKPEGYLQSKYTKKLTKQLRPIGNDGRLMSFSTIQIYSPFGSSENQLITGVLRGTGDNCALYVHDDYNEEVSDGVASSLLKSFDEITQKRNRAIWGTESDINADGGTVIFLSDDLGTGVLGFFRTYDLFPQSVIDEFVCAEDGEPAGCVKVNEMEIIFSQYVHDNFYKELIDATLAHEYFHLINYSLKTISRFTDSGQIYQEDLWLNEGMAHLSEDLTGHGFDSFKTAGYYLEEISRASIGGDVDSAIQMGFGDDTLERRGGAMLFLRYLFEQKGGADYSSSDAGNISGPGADFLRELNTSIYSGVNNIEKTYGDSFENLFRTWLATLVLDGTGLSDNPEYNYDPEQDDSFTAQKRGFNLRGSRDLPTGGKVDLEGPYMSFEWSTEGSGIRDFSSQVYESGADMFLVTVGAGKSLDIKMQGLKNKGLGMTIVRVK